MPDVVWSFQRAIRQNSLVLPCGILAVAVLLVVAYHVMFEREEHIQAFLIVVLMTMLPLAYVDANISKCNDPMAIFHSWGLKVTLMHAGFLILRAFVMSSTDIVQDIFANKSNILGSLGAVSAILLGFHKQLEQVPFYFDLGVLILMAFTAGIVTLCLNFGFTYFAHFHFHPAEIGSMTSDYMEVLAFFPAAWTVFREGKKDSKPVSVDETEYKRNAVAFGAMVIGFYTIEDMVTAMLTIQASPFEAIAHVLHYLLLVDLGVYVISTAYDPSHQSRGTVLTRFGDSLFSDSV